MAHYLEDAAELYRQFLRHMVETQWLLSAIVPFQNIPLKAGLDLLARDERDDHTKVANAIQNGWQSLEEADAKAWGASMPRDTVQVPAPDIEPLTCQIRRLREAISWQLAPSDWHTKDIKDIVFRPLAIHALGYSMGGFVAQATMFTWPHIIATCTMLASGGSLADVRASFVHEAEWRHVLNRLLPDLENPAIAHQIPVVHDDNRPNDQTPIRIYGLPRGYYSAFRRAFDQIFLQRSLRRGEYTDWLEEFHERLFFILGGSDPVVRVANVIESAPPSGLNTIEIADLKHELHDRQLHEWQKFWLPGVVTRTIEDFVRRREKGHYNRLKSYWRPLDSIPSIVLTILSTGRNCGFRDGAIVMG